MVTVVTSWSSYSPVWYYYSLIIPYKNNYETCFGLPVSFNICNGVTCLGIVHQNCGDCSYFVEDSVGDMERIWREDIITEADDADAVLQVQYKQDTTL